MVYPPSLDKWLVFSLLGRGSFKVCSGLAPDSLVFADKYVCPNLSTYVNVVA